MDMQIDGSKIRQLRRERAWSQEHLAHVASLGLRTVQRMETDSKASYESLRALASAFDLQPADLLRKPAQTSTGTHPPARRMLAACSLGLATLAGTFVLLGTPAASAEQVRLGLQLSLEDTDIVSSEVVVPLGERARITLPNQFRVEWESFLPPNVSDALMLKFAIYDLRGPEEVLLSEPAMLVTSGQEAMLRVTPDDAAGEAFALRVTPTLYP